MVDDKENIALEGEEEQLVKTVDKDDKVDDGEKKDNDDEEEQDDIKNPEDKDVDIEISNKKEYDGIDLSWHNIELKVDIKDKRAGTVETKVILNKVSGIAKRGRLTCILGPSGSGKTSLLSALAGIIDPDIQASGQILANNERLGSNFKKIGGLVLQDDLLLANQTCHETFLFSAMLRLPRSMTVEEKEKRVEDTIMELGLRKVRNTKIGNEFSRGVSGGERKRIAVGVEVIRNVKLLLLDEPTSGLDSYMSYNVMKTMKRLAHSGRTVVCTIHQPRSNIFELFDDIILMSEGNVMYFGPAQDAVPYFSKIGYKCGEYYNPADYFLDIISVDTRSKESEKSTLKRVNQFRGEYEKLEASREFKPKEEVVTEVYDVSNVQATASFGTQFKLLAKRSFNELSRNKFATVLNFMQNLIFGLIIGILYLGVGLGQESVQNRTGVLFFVIINQSFGAMFQTVSAFIPEKSIFRRERRAEMYTTGPYFWAKMSSELPIQIIAPITFGTITYWMVGLQADINNYLIFISVILCTSLVAQSVGLSIGSLAPNINVANMMAPLVMILFLLMGGLYVNLDSIPDYFVWLEAISFIKYGYRALLKNEFNGLTFECTSNELTLNPRTNTTGCPIPSGDVFLTRFGIDPEQSIASDILALVGLAVLFRFFCYLALKRRTKNKVL